MLAQYECSWKWPSLSICWWCFEKSSQDDRHLSGPCWDRSFSIWISKTLAIVPRADSEDARNSGCGSLDRLRNIFISSQSSEAKILHSLFTTSCFENRPIWMWLPTPKILWTLGLVLATSVKSKHQWGPLRVPDHSIWAGRPCLDKHASGGWKSTASFDGYTTDNRFSLDTVFSQITSAITEPRVMLKLSERIK